MTKVCLEDFPNTWLIKVIRKRVVSQSVVRISIPEHTSVRRQSVVNIRMTPLTLSDRQQPSDRTCGRSCVLETSFVISVIYFPATRYFPFNNWSESSVFKFKERKLSTKQLLNTYRWRKFI